MKIIQLTAENVKKLQAVDHYPDKGFHPDHGQER